MGHHLTDALAEASGGKMNIDCRAGLSGVHITSVFMRKRFAPSPSKQEGHGLLYRTSEASPKSGKSRSTRTCPSLYREMVPGISGQKDQQVKIYSNPKSIIRRPFASSERRVYDTYCRYCNGLPPSAGAHLSLLQEQGRNLH